MYTFNIKIADIDIEVNTIYPDTKELCKDYLCENKGIFSISTNQEDIEFERKKSFQEAIYEGLVPYEYSDGYLETIAVYRKIANKLIEQSIVVFHGAVIEVDNKGYLFTAKSGTGKTTHINLWMDKFKDKCTIVNGDKPLLKIKEDGIYAYGTPWCGKENLNTNTSVKLKGICILNRGEVNKITKIEFKEALDILLQQTNRPSNPTLMIKTLSLVNLFKDKVDLYKLYCNMEKEAADISYEGMCF